MPLTMRPYENEDDFWRIRSFLREVFLLNGRREHSWHVARFDYWRWHLIGTCQACDPVERVTTLWQTAGGELAAVLHPVGWGEIRLHVHPHFRTPALEEAMLAHAEAHLYERSEEGKRRVLVPTFTDDAPRQALLARSGYARLEGRADHWQRDLDAALPQAEAPAGYALRSMGPLAEHAARSWASWRSFHSDEPEEVYDGDWSWFRNVQLAPLYRRDLDVVAEAPDGGIAAFCTAYYDDATRSAVTVLVGTAVEHWRKGLGRAVVVEAMRRLAVMGCTRVFATGYDARASALYGSVMQACDVSEAWVKRV